MTTDDEPLAALRQANLELRAQLAQLAPIAAKYHALCTVTPDLMLVLDQDGRYLEIAQTRGITPELIAQRLTTTIHETFPADLVAEMLDAIRRTLATGRSTRLEYDVPYADTVQRHAAELTPLSATTVLWFARDVTSARQLERTERTLRTFETIVESSPDGVALVAPDGALAYTNSALRALLGRDPAALAASTLHDHVDPRAALVEALADALARGTWHGRMTLRRADGGERPCQLSLVRLQREHDDSKPTQLAAIARDLTPIIEAEQHRVALQEQIIAAQRSALRELSTPLLPLAPGILAMPLIGTLDRERANEVMETLLAGITAAGIGALSLAEALTATGLPDPYNLATVGCKQMLATALVNGKTQGVLAAPVANPSLGAFSGSSSGCPNKWANAEGRRGEITGYQTKNDIANSDELSSALWNETLDTNAVFLEAYEDDLWRALQERVSLGNAFLSTSAAGYASVPERHTGSLRTGMHSFPLPIAMPEKRTSVENISP